MHSFSSLGLGHYLFLFSVFLISISTFCVQPSLLKFLLFVNQFFCIRIWSSLKPFVIPRTTLATFLNIFFGIFNCCFTNVDVVSICILFYLVGSYSCFFFLFLVFLFVIFTFQVQSSVIQFLCLVDQFFSVIFPPKFGTLLKSFYS